MVSIAQTEIYRARGGEEKCMFSKVARTQSEQIKKKCLKTWKVNASIPLSVMSTIDNTYCKCITVYFTLKVKMKVPWASNMDIVVPLTVCDSYIQNKAP